MGMGVFSPLFFAMFGGDDLEFRTRVLIHTQKWHCGDCGDCGDCNMFPASSYSVQRS